MIFSFTDGVPVLTAVAGLESQEHLNGVQKTCSPLTGGVVIVTSPTQPVNGNGGDLMISGVSVEDLMDDG